ncbi:DUF2382 domain-containing protein [Mucilaginibacter sp.]
MSHTVIGVFNYTSEAQEAKQYLSSNGFNSEDVDIATQDGTASSTGDTGDRIGSFFSNLFTSDDDENVRSKYTEAGRKGTIVTVHARTSEQAMQAVEILDQYGAIDVNESSYQNEGRTGAANSGKIDVIEEELQVGKREVETGGVRLRSRIVERPVEESIRLREEHVNIERTAVNRPATEADFAGFKEGTVEVTEHAERAVVAKEARVVEEVSLNKEVAEREETIRDTVRHTEVDTENITGKDSTYTSGTDTDTTSDKL